MAAVGRISSRKSRSFLRRERSETASTSFIRAKVPGERGSPPDPIRSADDGRRRRHPDRPVPPAPDEPRLGLARAARRRHGRNRLAASRRAGRRPGRHARKASSAPASCSRSTTTRPNSTAASRDDPLLGAAARALVGYRPLRARDGHPRGAPRDLRPADRGRARSGDRAVDPASTRRRRSRRATASPGSLLPTSAAAGSRPRGPRRSSALVRTLDLERLRDHDTEVVLAAARAANAGSARGPSA